MAQRRSDLDTFFHPASVAVLGRVDRTASPDALLDPLRARYGCDRVYLVHPKGGTVGDVPVYPSVLDIPDTVELAVVNVGARAVPDAVDECGRKGIAYVLVFTAGFAEVGGEGVELERRLGEVARRHGIRVFGPNTNTNAFERMPDVPGLCGGKIGLVTQSGHQGRPIVQGSEFGVGFSRWVPTGNEVDLEAADFVEYFADDDETAVIAGYFEGFKDPDRLRVALTAAAQAGKPVVALKIGSTDAGRRMASSHTGHLTGSDAVVDGLFAQYAVTRVRDLDELLDTAALFAKLPAGCGTRLALYAISGGSGTLMAELAESAGLAVPQLSEATRAGLRELLPDYLTVSNPVDNGGTFVLSAAEADRVRVLELITTDDTVDVVVIGLTGAVGAMTDTFAADIRAFVDRSPKPIVVTWNSYKTDEPGFADVVASGVPLFRSFRNCFASLAAWGRYVERSAGFRVRTPMTATLPASAARSLDAGGALDAADARRLLERFGVPLVAETVAATPGEAAKAAADAGFPVVLKIASADFPHKSDAGLVRVGVADPEEARAVAAELLERATALDPAARIDGVLVQPMVTDGVEMIVGLTQDPVFGPAVMVGTGGIFAEVLADVAVRPLPLDRGDALEMIRGLRGHALLAGARGRPAADVEALADVVLAVAALATAAGPRLAELDLNPVLVRPDGVVVVDNLVVAAG